VKRDCGDCQSLECSGCARIDRIDAYNNYGFATKDGYFPARTNPFGAEFWNGERWETLLITTNGHNLKKSHGRRWLRFEE